MNKIIFEKEIIVQAKHLDSNNHVNNVQFVAWVEEMAAGHWDAVRHLCPYTDDFFILVEHHIQYKKQVYLGDKLLVKTYPISPTSVKQPRKVEFYRNDELVVDSLTHWILISHLSKKIIRLPQNWLDDFRV